MHMRTLRVLLLLVLALALTGCKGKGIKDIKVNSARIVSVTPEGLNGLTALVEVDVHNPTVSFELTNISGLARYKGQDALLVTADQLIVAGHTDKKYRIPVQGEIVEGFNPLQLVRLVSSESSFDDVTLTIKGKVALRGGIGKNIELKDIPLSSLMKKPQEANDPKVTE